MKTKLIDLIVEELQKNKIFEITFIECLEMYPEIKENEKKEKIFYSYVSILENYNCYINYIFLIIDITKLIEKRFNNILNIENVLKSLEIIKFSEA